MKDYTPFYSKTDDEVTLADVIESYFDVIKAAIPTEDNPLKAQVTYTTPEGDDFNINIAINVKTKK